MQILEHTLIWGWCRSTGVALDDDCEVTDDAALDHRTRIVFAPDGPTGDEPAVASAIVRALGGWDECLVWARRWGVWASSEDWPRYYAFRARHGSKLSIDHAPGHLARRGDAAELHELLTLLLEFGWDALVLAANGGRALPVRVTISHDGWLVVASDAPVRLAVAE